MPKALLSAVFLTHLDPFNILERNVDFIRVFACPHAFEGKGTQGVDRRKTHGDHSEPIFFGGGGLFGDGGFPKES